MRMKARVLSVLLFFLALTVFSQNSLKDISLEHLKLELPVLDSISAGSYENEFRLDESNWSRFGFNALEKFSSNFKYSIYGQSNVQNQQLIFVKRDYEEENIHWVCLLNDEGKLVDFLQTAYENSEGFMMVKSELTNAHVMVKTWNMYNDPNDSEIRYSITNQGFKK